MSEQIGNLKYKKPNENDRIKDSILNEKNTLDVLHRQKKGSSELKDKSVNVT